MHKLPAFYMPSFLRSRRITEDGTRVPKHVEFKTCYELYLINAFIGWHVDCKNCTVYFFDILFTVYHYVSQ
jgi:hypothetical protein